MKAERGVVRFERGSRFRGKIDNRQDCLSATVAPTPSSATLILSASSLVTRPLTIAFDEVFGFLEASEAMSRITLMASADSEENDRELTARFGGRVGEADRPNRSETDAAGANWPLAFR